MALFFDVAWFDAALARAGLRRDEVGLALGLDAAAVAELWKDQRELSARDVRILAALLDQAPQEVASRAGISTPVPDDGDEQAALGEVVRDLSIRLAAVERDLAAIKAQLAKAEQP